MAWAWPFRLLVFHVSSCSSEERLNSSLVAKLVFPFFHQLDLTLWNQSGLIREWAEVSVITTHTYFSVWACFFFYTVQIRTLAGERLAEPSVSWLCQPLKKKNPGWIFPELHNSSVVLLLIRYGSRKACLCYKPHHLLDAKLPISSVWDVWNTVIILWRICMNVVEIHNVFLKA